MFEAGHRTTFFTFRFMIFIILLNNKVLVAIWFGNLVVTGDNIGQQVVTVSVASVFQTSMESGNLEYRHLDCRT